MKADNEKSAADLERFDGYDSTMRQVWNAHCLVTNLGEAVKQVEASLHFLKRDLGLATKQIDTAMKTFEEKMKP